MKEISLTQGKVAIVDDADFEEISKYKWYAYGRGYGFYAIRNMGKTTQYMHQSILGKKEGLIIDHINGDGLDNRRCNLRHVTHRQNLQNRHKPAASKYPGVRQKKDRRHKCWIAQIGHKGTVKYIGCFSNELDAYNAYCKAVVGLGETML